MVTLLTRARGVVSASARSARRPTSRLGALEPMHTLRVGIDVGAAEEIAKLKEARIERVRLRLLDDEPRIQAASRLLTYGRAMMGEGPDEALSFDLVERGLDAIADSDPGAALAVVVWSGAQLLASAGYELGLEACVRCGTPCPPRAAALVDPAAGGLVCRACGGGPILLGGAQRLRVAAFLRSRQDELTTEDLEITQRIVSDAIEAHDRPQNRPQDRRGPASRRKI